MKNHRRNANPEKTAAVEAIASILCTLKPDEVVPYERLGNLMMGDRNLLRRAMKLVNETHGFMFGTIYKVGVKRLSQRVAVIDAAFERTHKLMNRTQKTGVNSLLHEAQDMSRTEKIELTSRVNAIGAIQLAVKLARGK